MNENYSFLLRTHCATYNHYAYITDAMDGFCMQQTTFPFVCTIVDDASTDGEQEAIKDYLHKHFDLENQSVAKKDESNDCYRFFARHKTNENCYFAVILLKYNHYRKKGKFQYYKEWTDTKYIALCEGDDYWTDPMKLQKQVGFLEAHEDYSMCFHRASIIKEMEEGPNWLYCEGIKDRDYSATELLEKWIVPTASMVFRSKISLFKINNPNNILNGDIFTVEKCAHCGRVRGMSERMSVYRVHPNGVTYDQSRQKERIICYPKHYKELRSDFPLIDKKTIDSFIGGAYFNKAGIMENLLAKSWYIIVGSLYCPGLLLKKIKRVLEKLYK